LRPANYDHYHSYGNQDEAMEEANNGQTGHEAEQDEDDAENTQKDHFHFSTWIEGGLMRAAWRPQD
jgi:hypothetical protein